MSGLGATQIAIAGGGMSATTAATGTAVSAARQGWHGAMRLRGKCISALLVAAEILRNFRRDMLCFHGVKNAALRRVWELIAQSFRFLYGMRAKFYVQGRTLHAALLDFSNRDRYNYAL